MYRSSGVDNDPNHLNDSSWVVKNKLKCKVRPKLNIEYYLAWIKRIIDILQMGLSTLSGENLV